VQEEALTGGQGEGILPADHGSGRNGMKERRGARARGWALTAGVAGLVVVSFASWRELRRIDTFLGERLSKLAGRSPGEALPRGPDPNRVYPIQTEGSPSRGRADAPVTIAAFSDFQ
jgi:hypothetical protein